MWAGIRRDYADAVLVCVVAQTLHATAWFWQCYGAGEQRMLDLHELSEVCELSKGWKEVVRRAVAEVMPFHGDPWNVGTSVPLFLPQETVSEAQRSVAFATLLHRAIGVLMQLYAEFGGRGVFRMDDVNARDWSKVMAWCKAVLGWTSNEWDRMNTTTRRKGTVSL
jgi:hypothetical protein